jgi:hypothetical protein
MSQIQCYILSGTGRDEPQAVLAIVSNWLRRGGGILVSGKKIYMGSSRVGPGLLVLQRWKPNQKPVGESDGDNRLRRLPNEAQ